MLLKIQIQKHLVSACLRQGCKISQMCYSNKRNVWKCLVSIWIFINMEIHMIDGNMMGVSSS